MWIALVLALGLAAAPTMQDLTFLTRDGCVNTPDMVNNLDDALTALNCRRTISSSISASCRRTIHAPATRRRRSSGRGKTSLACRHRSHRTTYRVDASTRAEFRP